MVDPKLAAATDLWSVRVLAGFGSTLPVRTFTRLMFLGLVLVGPVAMASVLFLLQLSTTFLTGEPTGSAANARLAAALSALMVVGFLYAALLDLGRTHLSSAAQIISESPMKGLWLAADISLWRVVLAERAPTLAARALVQLGALSGAALYLHRSAHPHAADLFWCAVMLPVAFLTSSLALAAVHAAGRRRRLGAWQWMLALLPLNLLMGLGLATLADREMPSRDVAGSHVLTGLLGMSQLTGWVRIGVTALLVLALAALTVVAARELDLAAHIRRGAVSRPRPRGSTGTPFGTILRGAGGLAGMPVSLRVVLAAAAVAAVVLGWRLGGGGTLPATATSGVTRTLVFLGAGAGMAIAAGALVRLGQSSRLWHYRSLWEAGVHPSRLWPTVAAPALALAALAGLALCITLWAATGEVTALPLLVIVTCVASEQLVDSFFARAAADEGARTGNSLLAVVGYLATVPTLFVGLSLRPWATPTLLILFILTTFGGFWWFTKRLRMLPIVTAE